MSSGPQRNTVKSATLKDALLAYLGICGKGGSILSPISKHLQTYRGLKFVSLCNNLYCLQRLLLRCLFFCYGMVFPCISNPADNLNSALLGTVKSSDVLRSSHQNHHSGRSHVGNASDVSWFLLLLYHIHRTFSPFGKVNYIQTCQLWTGIFCTCNFSTKQERPGSIKHRFKLYVQRPALIVRNCKTRTKSRNYIWWRVIICDPCEYINPSSWVYDCSSATIHLTIYPTIWQATTSSTSKHFIQPSPISKSLLEWYILYMYAYSRWSKL